jgi:hypothetical protein
MQTQMQHRIAGMVDRLPSGARDLPENATRLWQRARARASEAGAKAAGWVGSRTGRTGMALDMDGMTKDELMELARRQNLRGRSTMTKAQLAAALRRLRTS